MEIRCIFEFFTVEKNEARGTLASYARESFVRIIEERIVLSKRQCRKFTVRKESIFSFRRVFVGSKFRSDEQLTGLFGSIIRNRALKYLLRWEIRLMGMYVFIERPM